MDIEELRDFCLSLEGVEEKTPFGKFAKRYDSILVFYVKGHMFCLTDLDNCTYAGIRTTPEKYAELLEKYSSAQKSFNRAMRYWLQISFGGDCPDSEILSLIADSYNIIKQKYSERCR